MIDLQIPVTGEPVKRTYRLPKELSEEFDLYLEAAQLKQPGADESAVLEAILRSHMKKDRGFRSWLQRRRKEAEKKDAGPVLAENYG